jgi:hypothetical protein
MRNQPKITRLSFITLVMHIFTAACGSSIPSADASPIKNNPQFNPTGNPVSSIQTVQSPTNSPTSMPTIQPSTTPNPTSTPTAHIPTTAPSHTPTLTYSPTVTPTYAILRGTVLEQANCRYGPGAAYLYKYGLYAGNNIEIIGRNELGSWIVIQAIGGTNPCWVKASLLDIKGDVMSVAPASLPLPQSPYYGPLTGVSAQRNGNNVIVSWHPLVLRAGDDSLQYPYLIEAWVCQAGQPVFTPIGVWETITTVMDEPGCSEPSHARVYGVEKHGYTNWVTVPWPVP